MLLLDRYPQERYTDRDLELPVFYEFLERTKGEIGSVIDVGAHFSAGYYAPTLRKYATFYDALDPNYDQKVEEIADRFIEADALNYEFDEYDLVLCLSTIEHVGQYPFKYEDYKKARLELFKKLIAAAGKYLWISFPVGQEIVIPNEMALVGSQELDQWLELTKPYQTTVGYFFSPGPQAGYPWRKATREECVYHPYEEKLGTQALCVLEVKK
jgi:hypothetical protein